MTLRHSLSEALKVFEQGFRTLDRVEVSRSAILRNLALFQKLAPSGQVIPVLKANAYGHGLEQIAEILEASTIPYIAVDGYFEALRIRELSAQPLLIMGAIHPENFAKIKYKNFTFVIHDTSAIEALGKTGYPIKVHLEIDTGMSRHGVSISGLNPLLEVLKSYPRLQLEGVISHLADSDNADPTFTGQQTKKFDAAVERILAQGFTPTMFHLAQTAGSPKVASRYATTLRVGIGLYGINPLATDDKQYKKLTNLIPAMRITSTITKVVELKAGDTVSYGRTFTAKGPMYVGVLPFGYYEGLPRELSNKGQVLWNKKALPIVGRINMNHTMISLVGTSAKVGDEVTVLGGETTSPTSISSLATHYGLFPYTLLTGINENLRRVIVP